MKQLRLLHLYLGCLFAPLLIFFAVSGLWQIFLRKRAGVLHDLSTIHMVESGDYTLSSPLLKWIIVIMTISLIVTIVLGIIMALRFGHRKVAMICLIIGLVVPTGIILANKTAQDKLKQHTTIPQEEVQSEKSSESLNREESGG